jgi:hypothetical protein
MGDVVTERNRADLYQWLSESGNNSQLISFFQGSGLRRRHPDEEVFALIMDAISDEEDRKDVLHRRCLAERIAAFLSIGPSLHGKNPPNSSVLYNLLMTCAHLCLPFELGDALYNLFARRAVRGSYRGIPLVNALTVALILNQKDERLEPEWIYMLTHRSHPYLDGDEFTGLDGVTFMPRANCPFIVQPGKTATAFRAIAAYLDLQYAGNVGERDAEFAELVARILLRHPLQSVLKTDLLREGKNNGWPKWALAITKKLPGGPFWPDA